MKKKCYIDSNLLVYLKDQGSPFHRQAKNILKKLSPIDSELYISPLVIDEFLNSFRKILVKEKISKESIYTELDKLLESILDLEHLNIINPPNDKNTNKKVIEIMSKFNLRPRDAYHLLIMQENNIKTFATFDKDFKEVFKQNMLKLAK